MSASCTRVGEGFDVRIDAGNDKGRGSIYLTFHEAHDIHRQLGDLLSGFARIRIQTAQDTVDQIRSDNALRSDFV